MKLSFLDIKNARPEDKPYRISDGDGLSVQVQPNGHKLWRYRYRFAGVEKLLALGTFPATSLADARAKRDAARAALEKGIDPSVQKKLDKIAAATQARNTFGAIAEEYHREPPRARRGRGDDLQEQMAVARPRLADRQSADRRTHAGRARCTCSSWSRRAADARPPAGCAASWVPSFATPS